VSDGKFGRREEGSREGGREGGRENTNLIVRDRDDDVIRNSISLWGGPGNSSVLVVALHGDAWREGGREGGMIE